MAKQTNGFLGGFSGKLGPVVGYQWKGKWCMRAYQRYVHNPRTEAQQEHRAMFKEEVRLAGKMRWAVNIGLKEPADELDMTAQNLFVKANQQAFSLAEGRFTVDYASLTLSAGPVAPVAITEWDVDEDNVLSVRFEKNPMHASARAYDNVFVWVWCPEVQQGYLANSVYRRMGRLSTLLPEEMEGQEVHVYAFVQDDHGRCSATAYAGTGNGERETENDEASVPNDGRNELDHSQTAREQVKFLGKKNDVRRPILCFLGWVVLLLNMFAAEECFAQKEIGLNSNQADSVMAVIGGSKEVVLYCGYGGEPVTYMVLCDYWKEGVKGSEMGVKGSEEGGDGKFEVWVLGYDLHTGDTVCLPLSPSCIWIQKNGSVYNVGSYLSLDMEKRNFPYEWKVPKYSLVGCLEHTGGMQPSYHHKVHAGAHGENIWSRMEQDDRWSRDMEQKQDIERQRQKEYEEKLKQQSEDFRWEKAETERWQKMIDEEKDKRLRKELKNF